ncbi:MULTISPECIES: tRNA dihydrouridine synthase DusB [Thioalkalivibrio]|uniref:tRNA-dihydrouridine synthase n=1 Tax=Thioalkalivibrio versutus TaxID=106634 RepID=A0A0G3FYJ8_9GAMM|nr:MULTISPECIES: tRNA dihydrouridine synthase DusB [Thioalkalivibrio]AKJ94070.1 tRNA-dihydrouridine synthase B [Thioalkalivibrio versutus]OOC48567.1 tRNA dihydrouridine synthase DusB [Thioalkalivibrio versutus]
MQLGTHHFPDPVVFLAPMAGVSDRPFRLLARRLGASAAVSEMVTSDTRLWTSDKSRHRLDHRQEPRPRIVQLLGNEPEALAEAARENVRRGADVIDLNLGCPAKKVCSKAAGSALLGEPERVRELLQALTTAVTVPVTLKMRLGLDRERINGETIAAIAEDCGIAMLTVHGRTRADAYRGETDYAAIARIVRAVSIPVLANGDITGPEKALQVLDTTRAAGVMIGRAAQGQPWLPGQIRAALAGEPIPPAPGRAARLALIEEHIGELHAQYGEPQGVRIARKHLGWYLQGLGLDEARTRAARADLLAAPTASEQLWRLRAHLTGIASEAA